MNKKALAELPDDLPVPIDDGACRHLQGTSFPLVELPATSGELVVLTSVSNFVLYIYPMTGRPDRSLPMGWDSIPGARGCTPQSCGFRDRHTELTHLKMKVFGLSTQTTEYQIEAKQRLQLPFDLLSDQHLKLGKNLSLPTFEVNGVQLYKRTTMIVRNNIIEKVFYPIFPPDLNAEEVIEWLQTNTN